MSHVCRTNLHKNSNKKTFCMFSFHLKLAVSGVKSDNGFSKLMCFALGMHYSLWKNYLWKFTARPPKLNRDFSDLYCMYILVLFAGLNNIKYRINRVKYQKLPTMLPPPILLSHNAGKKYLIVLIYKVYKNTLYSNWLTESNNSSGWAVQIARVLGNNSLRNPKSIFYFTHI